MKNVKYVWKKRRCDAFVCKLKKVKWFYENIKKDNRRFFI